MKQDAENVGPAKYKIGDIVVVDLSIDKAIGYVLEVQETDGIFNGWYKIYEYLETNGRHIFEARQEWMETYEEFESRRYSEVR